jgi:hypothetical protein
LNRSSDAGQFGEMSKSNNVERKTRIAGWNNMSARIYRAKYKSKLRKSVFEDWEINPSLQKQFSPKRRQTP